MQADKRILMGSLIEAEGDTISSVGAVAEHGDERRSAEVLIQAVDHQCIRVMK